MLSHPDAGSAGGFPVKRELSLFSLGAAQDGGVKVHNVVVRSRYRLNSSTAFGFEPDPRFELLRRASRQLN